MTWGESHAVLAALAEMHDEIERLLMTPGLFSAVELSRLQAGIEATMLETSLQMIRDSQTAQGRAWLRGVEGFQGIMGSMEIRYIPGLTGLEDDLVRQFLTVDRIAAVTEEMKALIRTEIVNSVMMKRTPFEAMSYITNVLGIRDMAGFRMIGTTGISAKAERIVRTELMSIENSAAWFQMGKAANDFPDLEQIWLSTGDGRTRDAHLAAHGQVVKVGELFSVGGEMLRFPGDPSASARNRVNCRCRTAPYRAEWGTVDELIGPLDKKIEAEKEKRKPEAV